MSYLAGKRRQANGGRYNILPMPVLQAPPVSDGATTAPATTPATPASDPLASVTGLLDGNIAGIPIKYIAIGLAAWLLLKK